MPYELDRTPTYRLSAQYLGPLATIQLRLAERLIKSRPDKLPNTVEVPLGGRTVTLFGFGDLAIYLELRQPGTVSLYIVVDGKHLPDWFVNPTGSWFELVDLD
jgi:hypothetical protein